VQASGDLVPFEVILTRDGTKEFRRSTGSIDGAVSVQKNDERTQR
jgi:hypothetical protein